MINASYLLLKGSRQSMSISQQKILIIGGTSGFGFEIARQSLQQKANVTITGRHQETLTQAVTTLSQFGTVAGTCLDAHDEYSITHFFADQEKFDHIISMLGGAMGGGFLDNTNEAIKTAIETKFYLDLYLAKSAPAHLADNGSLILTSGAGRRYDQAAGAIIGNQAINGLVQGLALELAPRLRVNSVAPTWTPTKLWRDVDQDQLTALKKQQAAASPLQRLSSPTEVAKTYLFLMDCTFITGQTITVDGGSTLR